VDVKQRLLEDARSFAKEVTSLDEEGYIGRTLAVLGIPSTAGEAILDPENEEVPPSGPAAPSGWPRRGTTEQGPPIPS